MSNFKYKKVILKISGEALEDTTSRLILDANKLNAIGSLIKTMVDNKIKVGVVCGAGNIFRGRIAEEIVFNEITTGAGNDIEQATKMARRMVCEWGMSPLGFMAFGAESEPIFIGRELSHHKDYSEGTALKIDDEILSVIVFPTLLILKT